MTAQKVRTLRRVGLSLVSVWLVLQFLFTIPVLFPHGRQTCEPFWSPSLGAFLLFLWLPPIIGLACYAQAKGRHLLWGAVALVPVFGPVLGLAVIGLDLRLYLRPVGTFLRSLGTLLFILSIPALLLAIAIPNYLRFGVRSPQQEARLNLGGIYVAETAFFRLGDVGRYGTFHEVGFLLAGNSNHYTYRIDNSGKPGTVIPAKDGALTPDNTVVHARISPDGQHFTATATANLDDDPTLDQWHVTDGRGRPIHDTDDRKD